MANANHLIPHVASLGINGLNGSDSTNGLNGFDSSSSPPDDCWLSDQSKLEQLQTLRVTALGNAKMLYGSEKFKFFDIVIAYSQPDAKYGAVLVCSFNESTKILRKEVAHCPVKAARAIVHGLHVDTGLLFTKYDVGDQLAGQQGGTARGGEFGLYEGKCAVNNREEEQDDTSSLRRGDVSIPSGPRADRYSPRWVRGDTDRWSHDMYPPLKYAD
ncbi:hypothetical protein G6514_001913 [Epicoccum nigrum]|nr:hypothetical protein G6514_001913 [Epicoccum nigrum]